MGYIQRSMFFNDSDENSRQFNNARAQLLSKIRAAIGPDKLIIINTKAKEKPESITKLVNGFYMECNESTTPSQWAQIAKTLDYAEQNTRKPHVNILETWYDKGQGRKQEDKMRATVTIMLTHAPDAAAIFADPDKARARS